MAGVTIDDFGASFIHYLPGVVDTLRWTSTPRKVPLGKVKWEGEKLVKHVHVSLNAAVGATSDGGAIPTAKKNTYQPAESKRKFIVGAVKVSDGILNNTKTTKKAAITVLDSELKGLYKSIHKLESLVFMRDGTGIVALMGTDVDGSSNSTFTVDDARGLWDEAEFVVHDTTSTPTTPVPLVNFTVGSVARARDANDESVVTSSAWTTITSGIAANDYVVWKGSSSLDSFGLMPTGLDRLIDDGTSGTFQNISLSSYPRYTSPVIDANNSTVTPTILRRMMAMIAQESGQMVKRKSWWVGTSEWDMVNFSELYESEMRITPSDKTLGTDAPTFVSPHGQFTVQSVYDAPYGKIFFVDRKQISRTVQRELDWRPVVNGGGGILGKSHNSLHYTADALEICEYFIEDRRSCGKIENLAQTIDSAY